VLAEAGLLGKLLPELGLAFEHARPVNDAARVLVRSLQCAATERLTLAARFALVTLRVSTPGAVEALCERLKAPGDCRDLAVLAHRQAEGLARASALRAPDLLAVLERCDAFRRPERFDELLALCACAERGRRGWGLLPYPPATVLRRSLAAAAGVDAAAIASRSEKAGIAAAVRRARIAAIERSG
jgi:tRNA nucleotidyltransferase (CCA-adding enzyme)